MKRRREILSDILKNKRISAFGRKVYKAVAAIPEGETRSYGWVAARIGTPRAARAVGNALNKNPCPGIVPCHRVVRSDGSIGGFFRGRHIKRRMLKSEGVDPDSLRLL